MKKLSLEALNRQSEEDFAQAPKIPLVLVLDNIRSGLNIGSAMRTADAFAIEQVVLAGICAQPPHKEIMKSAIGAERTVNWTYYEEVKAAIASLKNEGYTIIGVEQTDESVRLDDFEVLAENKYALVVGNEVYGISDEILPLIDVAIEVPQFGTKHSLNVSVCTGIVLWEFAKPYLRTLE